MRGEKKREQNRYPQKPNFLLLPKRATAALRTTQTKKAIIISAPPAWRLALKLKFRFFGNSGKVIPGSLDPTQSSVLFLGCPNRRPAVGEQTLTPCCTVL